MNHRELPEYFCWSKIGAEAGESVEGILARKEAARKADGVFLWGIGQPIASSIRALLEVSERPEVLFTDMLGPAKIKDLAPPSVRLWRSAVSALDGTGFVMPQHSRVTSRGDRARHWALVCRSDTSILEAVSGAGFRKAELRNIASGKIPADQQITTAVRYVPNREAAGKRCLVRFRADLTPPFIVELRDPVNLPPPDASVG